MSLSFPASPTIGQSYHGLIWDGVKWASPFGPAGAAQTVLEVSMAANKTGLGTGWKTCAYDTIVTDTQSGYSPATGLFTPKQAGLYLISASICMNINAGQNNGIAILKNGSISNPESQVASGWSATTAIQNFSLSALVNCNGTTDTISVQGQQGTGQATFYSTANAAGMINMVATLLMVGPQGPAGTAGPGNKVLISSQVVTLGTPVASVNFIYPFTNQYDEYEIDIYNYQSVAGGTLLISRMSFDGSTFPADSNYTNAWTYGTASNTGGGGGQTATYGQVSGSLDAQSSSPALTGSSRVYFSMPWTTDRNKIFRAVTSSFASATGAVNWNITWSYNGTSPLRALQGLQFLASSGNIARGVFNFFGIVKAGAGGS